MNGKNVLEAVSQGTAALIGEADFDLASYANDTTSNKEHRATIPMKNCQLDPNAFIEIGIRTNSQ